MLQGSGIVRQSGEKGSILTANRGETTTDQNLAVGEQSNANNSRRAIGRSTAGCGIKRRLDRTTGKQASQPIAVDSCSAVRRQSGEMPADQNFAVSLDSD